MKVLYCEKRTTFSRANKKIFSVILADNEVLLTFWLGAMECCSMVVKYTRSHALACGGGDCVPLSIALALHI